MASVSRTPPECLPHTHQKGTQDACLHTSANLLLLTRSPDLDDCVPMNIDSIIQSVTNSARFLGRELTEKALVLIYALCDERTPAWARTVIFGALAYLLNPLDACPDPIPFVGLADDMAALLGAIATITGVISPEHFARARETASGIFG